MEENKKILVVGSNLPATILSEAIKRYNSNIDIIVIDKENKHLENKHLESELIKHEDAIINLGINVENKDAEFELIKLEEELLALHKSDYSKLLLSIPEPMLLQNTHYMNEIPRVDQYIRATPRISRNSICTCGSGKKFKRCCGK